MNAPGMVLVDIAAACDGSLGRERIHALRRQLENRSLYAAAGTRDYCLFDRLLTLLRERGVAGLFASLGIGLDQRQPGVG